MKNKIEIYQAKSGTEIRVKIEDDTVWLDAYSIGMLFNVNRPAIVKHIQNIYKSSELNEASTCSILEQVALDNKRRKMNFYNLDVIISVGYRVNSTEATQFRQWATARLKDFLVKGYTINQKRLDELGKIVNLIEHSTKEENLQLKEAKGLLEVLSNCTKSFGLLNQYDSQSLQTNHLDSNITYEIHYKEAITIISKLKEQLISKREATELFGKEKDKSFNSSLLSITQTFDGHYLYPSIEEQAANLLYFIIKNHSFSDGNKRHSFSYGF